MAIPALPSSLPIISSNGVTEPSSTSLIRLIFSSITLLSSCGALVMITKNMTNMSTAGTTAVRTGSTFSADLIARGRPAAGAALDEPEVLEPDRLAQSFGQRLVEPGGAEPPRSDLAVDRPRSASSGRCRRWDCWSGTRRRLACRIGGRPVRSPWPESST